MDCLVRLFYGGSVRKEDGVLVDMEEEMEMFDQPPSFSELLSRVEQKFVGAFTLKGRFDSGKTRAHYVLMPLRNEAHWLRYTRVIQQSNVTLAEVVVENGYRKEDVEDDDQGGRDAMPVPVQGRLVRDVAGPTEVEHAGEGGTLMAALVPLNVVRSRPQHHRGNNLDEGHPLNSGVCSESPVNKKGKKTCGKTKRSMNTDKPPAEPIPELSNEIVLDILVRLPVKSLLRCKSVCKGWRDIITDPFFVRAHLKRSASRCEQDPCLLITPHTLCRRGFSNHIHFYQWQQGASMATLMHDKDFVRAFRSIHRFVQCDGLVLVPTDTRFYLFNPATRETITLPDRGSNLDHSSVWDSCRCAGVGLDPCTGKHKVVRAFHRSIVPFPYTGMGTDMGMEVITVSGNSNGSGGAWREIKDDLPYPAAWKTGTAVNGFLFWPLAGNHRDNPQRPRGLLHLSLADETFGITRLPDSLGHDDFELDVLHGELCMSAHMCRYTITIWFLPIQEDGGQRQTWEQRYTVRLAGVCRPRPLAFLPGGQMLVYAEDKKDSEVCLYDMATAKLTTLFQLNSMKYQGRRARSWENIMDFNVHLYTESLVRISL